MNNALYQCSDKPTIIPQFDSTSHECVYGIPSVKRTTTILEKIREIYAILFCLNCRHELKRLIQWAQRKRLEKSLRLYLSRLEDVERRLFRYRATTPNLTTYAQGLHLLQKLLNPAPPYPPRGSAVGYRYPHI